MLIVTIQDSFKEVINDVQSGMVAEDKFWISMREPGANQKLHEIKVLPDKFVGDIEFKADGKDYLIDSKYHLKTGSKTVKLTGISCVSRIGDDIILGMKSGDLVIYNILTEEQTRVPDCHVLDIVEIRVFPSKEVIMTVGLDKQIKIWSLKEWKCIRVFNCFNTSNVELIGRGRNFVNGNGNGEVKLWECGSGKVVHDFVKVRNKTDEVRAIALFDSENKVGTNELEYETNDKLVIVNYSLGDFMIFNLFTKQLENIDLNYQISSIQVVDNVMVFGTEDGQLVIYDLKTRAIKYSHRFNNEPIKLTVKKTSSKLQVVLYNGEETLIMADIDNYELKKLTYLGGLPEFFKVEGMIYDKQLIVASDYGVTIYGS